jgi:hypothetical protein
MEWKTVTIAEFVTNLYNLHKEYTNKVIEIRFTFGENVVDDMLLLDDKTPIPWRIVARLALADEIQIKY